jgi:hypothetical protein
MSTPPQPSGSGLPPLPAGMRLVQVGVTASGENLVQVVPAQAMEVESNAVTRVIAGKPLSPPRSPAPPTMPAVGGAAAAAAAAAGAAGVGVSSAPFVASPETLRAVPRASASATGVRVEFVNLGYPRVTFYGVLAPATRATAEVPAMPPVYTSEPTGEIPVDADLPLLLLRNLPTPPGGRKTYALISSTDANVDTAVRETARFEGLSLKSRAPNAVEVPVTSFDQIDDVLGLARRKVYDRVRTELVNAAHVVYPIDPSATDVQMLAHATCVEDLIDKIAKKYVENTVFAVITNALVMAHLMNTANSDPVSRHLLDSVLVVGPDTEGDAGVRIKGTLAGTTRLVICNTHILDRATSRIGRFSTPLEALQETRLAFEVSARSGVTAVGAGASCDTVTRQSTLGPDDVVSILSKLYGV